MFVTIWLTIPAFFVRISNPKTICWCPIKMIYTHTSQRDTHISLAWGVTVFPLTRGTLDNVRKERHPLPKHLITGINNTL